MEIAINPLDDDSGVSRGSRDRTRRDQTRSSSNAQQRDHMKYPAPEYLQHKEMQVPKETEG